MKRCNECCEDRGSTSDIYCSICGSQLEAYIVNDNSHNANISENHFEEVALHRLLDLFGSSFRNEFEDNIARSSKQRSISPDYVSKIGRIVVDDRLSILWNCIIELGPLKINGVIGSFVNTPFPNICSKLSMCSPQYGEGVLEGYTPGSILLMKRGVIPFSEKVQKAQDVGASALIIGQNSDIWPFLMTDSTCYFNNYQLHIPVVMINQVDFTLITNIITDITTSNNSSKNEVLNSVSISCCEGSKECCICQNNMNCGDIVLKLPCTHCYHEGCILQWLDKHNTCPMCRHQMPVNTTGKSLKPSNNSSESHRQPYLL
jgi:hypothetical protein